MKQKGLKLALRPHTTVVVTGTKTVADDIEMEDAPLYRYKISEDGEYILVKDYVDDDREFTEEEYEEFYNSVTLQDAIDFHIDHEEDSVPYRVYKVYQDIMWEELKYFFPGGQYFLNDNSDETIGVFKTTIPSNASDETVNTVKEELSFILNRYNKAKPEQKIIRFGIMNNDLSYNGVPEFFISFDGKSKVTFTRYSLEKEEGQFDNLDDLINYISKNHGYDNP